jgi:dTDP-4-dehydrorhamnose reductase
MPKTNILITGAGGQTGQEFQALAATQPDWDFHFANSGDLDVGDEKAVSQFFQRHRFDWVVNCAAYTAVDKAESEKELARRINAQGPANLALACKNYGSRLVHLSTDYVFHTQQNTPFREDDPTHPQGVYAATKLAGEDAVRTIYSEGSTIIRTSWVFSIFGNNFVKTMLRLGRERSELRVVSDQIGSPTHARDIAKAILHAILQVEEGKISSADLNGIFHFSNEGVASWYDFACAIFELAQIPCEVSPIDTAQFPTPAKRPPFSVLHKGKWKVVTGQSIPHWRESLKDCLAAMAY